MSTTEPYQPRQASSCSDGRSECVEKIAGIMAFSAWHLKTGAKSTRALHGSMYPRWYKRTRIAFLKCMNEARAGDHDGPPPRTAWDCKSVRSDMRNLRCRSHARCQQRTPFSPNRRRMGHWEQSRDSKLMYCRASFVKCRRRTSVLAALGSGADCEAATARR
jgi:hypothetical protein